jgi:hypothetical protein
VAVCPARPSGSPAINSVFKEEYEHLQSSSFPVGLEMHSECRGPAWYQRATAVVDAEVAHSYLKLTKFAPCARSICASFDWIPDIWRWRSRLSLSDGRFKAFWIQVDVQNTSESSQLTRPLDTRPQRQFPGRHLQPR